MIKIMQSMLILILISATASAAPQAFQARYAVLKSGLSLGEMQASLNYTGEQYTYTKQTKASGLAALLSGDTLTESSRGTYKNQQFSSQHYLHHHKSHRKDRRDQFSFTAPTQVKGQYKDSIYTLNVPVDTLDPALLELRIMGDIAEGKALHYRITEKGRLKDYHFRKLGRETLNLPAGRYECEKIQMVRDNGERTTTIWLAEALNYLPVQIRHSDDGDIIETQLMSHQPR